MIIINKLKKMITFNYINPQIRYQQKKKKHFNNNHSQAPTNASASMQSHSKHQKTDILSLRRSHVIEATKKPQFSFDQIKRKNQCTDVFNSIRQENGEMQIIENLKFLENQLEEVHNQHMELLSVKQSNKKHYEAKLRGIEWTKCELFKNVQFNKRQIYILQNYLKQILSKQQL